MRSCTNFDAFSKVRHTSTGFPKRCDRILISVKDIFKTHLREAYIMMILCDTEIRTYVLLKKGQTTAARKKKWDFLDFPVGLPNLRGRKSGTSWVWKLMEALKSVMIIIFVEFINQLIDFPINHASLNHDIVTISSVRYNTVSWDTVLYIGTDLQCLGTDCPVLNNTSAREIID